MNESSIAQLVTSRPDVDVAKDLKIEILAKLEEVCAIADKVVASGFQLAFNIGPRWDGKQIVTLLTIVKHF